MEKMHDLVIIGSGPAGLSAAIYAARAELDTLVIEKEMVSGGQVLTTYEVDNYPGLPGIGGYELGMQFRAHADKLGVPFAEDEVTALLEEQTEEVLEAASLEKKNGRIWKIICSQETYYAKAVLIATGAKHRLLGVPGEKELTGMGVSYCATCDGAFFRKKKVAVIGGGDVAIEDAIFLSRMCEKVYLIHRRNELRGAKSLQKQLFAQANVEVIWDSVVEKINGESKTESVDIKNVKTGEQTKLALDGVFVAVGIAPETEQFKGMVDMDDAGYIRASEDGVTSAPGIFAAGDVRTKKLRQIITAAADGANAITSIENYLQMIR